MSSSPPSQPDHASRSGDSPSRVVRQIFMDAMDVEPGRRAQFLMETCANQEAVRREVEDLLRAVDDAGSFLGQPDSAPAEVVGERIGDRIGDYTLRERLGEGGFGVVFLADQDRPVRRQVALKVIKLGMDTRQVVARFEAERQALAVMDHPCIAKVFDAGATSGGRPYFVMEVVRGQAITRFADEQRLTIRQRLELFLDVCEAVHHAHQKGVIHRDLKPSNVLVALHDGTSKPLPKIIDFGIAKATRDSSGPDVTLTEARQLIGTPEYMAPEQADYGGDIDTRADVYSLGVVLYELLVGCTPLDRARLRSGDAVSIQRYLKEQEPVRPSTRLRTLSPTNATRTAADEDRSPTTLDISRTRAVDAHTLARQLKGDLDWIAMKCLEKDRSRRYDSAATLAADLRRYLANEPVLAGPPTTWYRFHKAVVRHKVAFVAGTAVAAALVVGLGAATYQYAHVRVERDQKDVALRSVEIQRARAEKGEADANKARQRAERFAEFMKNMLSAVSPHRAAGKDTALLRETLDAATERANKELADAPDIHAELLLTIGETYRNIAQYAKAEESLRTAVDLYAKSAAADDKDAAQARLALGITLRFGGKGGEAVALAGKEIENAQHGSGVPKDVVTEFMLLRADALNDLGKFEEAMPIARECIERFKDLPERQADARLVLGAGLRRKGKLDESRREYERAIEYLRSRSPDRDVALAAALNNLGVVADAQGRSDEAESLTRESLAIKRSLYDKVHPDIAATLMNLGDTLVAKGKFDEGIPLLKESVAMHHDLYHGKHVGEAITMNRLALAYFRLGELDKCAELMEGAHELFLELRPAGHPDIVTSLSYLSMLRRAQVRLEESESLVREAIAMMAETKNTSSIYLAPLYQGLGDTLVQEKKYEEAVAAFDEALRQCEKMSGASGVASALQRCLRADALLELGRYDEAEQGLEEALNTLQKGKNRSSREVCLGREALARVWIHRARFADAAPLLSIAYDDVNPPDPQSKASGKHAVARIMIQCLEGWERAAPGSVKPEELATWRERLPKDKISSPQPQAETAPIAR